MKALIQAHGAPVRTISTYYYLAYCGGISPFWWNVRQSGGPIIEQATHMIDVARYLAGEVVPGTIQTICQPASDPAAHLSKLAPGIDVGLPEDARVPRATMSTWRFQCGGIGALTHVIALHSGNIEASMDVILDGLRIRWLDPYGPNARLEVRGLPESPEEEQILQFGHSDPYKEELSAFLHAVRTGDRSVIASPYSDAVKTYQLSRDIVSAAEYNMTN